MVVCIRYQTRHRVFIILSSVRIVKKLDLPMIRHAMPTLSPFQKSAADHRESGRCGVGGIDQWARFSRPATKRHIHQSRQLMCRSRRPVPFIMRGW